MSSLASELFTFVISLDASVYLTILGAVLTKQFYNPKVFSPPKKFVQ